MPLTTEQRLQQLELTVASLEAMITAMTTKLNSVASKTVINRALAMNQITLDSIQSRLTTIENALKLHFENGKIQ